MPLTLVLGPANAAKAGEVLDAYALAARRDALLVVPTAADVAHYERELAAPGVTLGRVLTFPGLMEEIAARARHRRTLLTSLQRERVLARAIEAVRLEALAASAGGNGFVRAAGRLVSELEQARVDATRFAAALRAWAGGRRDRGAFARELGAIYLRYTGDLAQLDRVDRETFAWETLDALRELPERWGGTPVFLYGFDDLTPMELDAVETLARAADAAVMVSLTYEPGRPALAARATVVEELRALAQSVIQLPALDEHYRPQSRAALHHLERNLFEPGAPVIDPGEAVFLLEAGGARAEAELVAAEVLAALRDGVDPRQIVIVCRSLAGSAELFEGALARYGVPSTSARTVPLGHTALGRALLALGRYALAPASQRSAEDLLAYLRHPGVAETAEAVDRFELQVRREGGRITTAARLRGEELRGAFTAVEQLRLATDVITALLDATRWLLAAPYRGTAALLQGPQEADARAAAAVIAALEELHALEPGGPPRAGLLALLEGLQIPVHGTPPEGAVLISEPWAIRARRFRRVFVTGLCEGEFPSPHAALTDPFLSDDRRRELALGTGLVLSQPGDPLDRERYLLYACLSRATERVGISYRSSDEDGNVVLASPFLDDVAELFVGGWRDRRRRRLLADVTWSEQDAPTERERALSQALAESMAQAPAQAFRGDGSAGATGQRAGGPAQTQVLSLQAMTHVRHRLVVSAGALEAFAACPVRWLVERQLDPEQLEPEQLAIVRGSLIHAVLERVFGRLGTALTPRTLGKAEDLLFEEMRGSAAAEPRTKLGAEQPTAVRAAMLRGIEAELQRYLRLEARDGCDWLPLVTELRFGLDVDIEGSMPPVELSSGDEHALLSGVIDRIDTEPGDGERVIVRDYKSGSVRTSWPRARWLEERQIQVALYMIAVQRLLGVRAAAGLYQPLAGDDTRPRGAYLEGAAVGDRVLARDALTEGELDELLGEIEAEAVRLAATLRRGELTPCPERCSPDGTCRYPGICWAQS